MKKTHEDRINLIDRLERKYARKIQLRNEMRRQNIRNTLRSLRGQRFDAEDMRADSMDGILRHDPRMA